MLLLGLSLPVVEAAKDETKSKGGAPAKYPENAKAIQILLRAAKDAHHPTVAEAREALRRVSVTKVPVQLSFSVMRFTSPGMGRLYGGICVTSKRNRHCRRSQTTHTLGPW